MRQTFIKAHEMTREIANNYEVDYRAQFGLCLSYLLKNKEEATMDRVKGIIKEFNVPKTLQGTEKQVKWADKIRIDAYKTMQNAVIREDFIQKSMTPMGKDKTITRDVSKLFKTLQSQEAIAELLEEIKDLPEERQERTIESLNGVYDRYNRLAEIMQNDEAKFWIDNRDNQEKNYMFLGFVEYIKTGVKNF